MFNWIVLCPYLDCIWNLDFGLQNLDEITRPFDLGFSIPRRLRPHMGSIGAVAVGPSCKTFCIQWMCLCRSCLPAPPMNTMGKSDQKPGRVKALHKAPAASTTSGKIQKNQMKQNQKKHKNQKNGAVGEHAAQQATAPAAKQKVCGGFSLKNIAVELLRIEIGSLLSRV